MSNRGKSSHWTDAEVALLIRLASEGHTASSAAAIIGRPRAGVRHKGYMIGHPLRYESTWSPPKEPKIDTPTPKPVASRNTTSLTAMFFGDPIPGRSALDQKLAKSGGTI